MAPETPEEESRAGAVPDSRGGLVKESADFGAFSSVQPEVLRNTGCVLPPRSGGFPRSHLGLRAAAIRPARCSDDRRTATRTSERNARHAEDSSARRPRRPPPGTGAVDGAEDHV